MRVLTSSSSAEDSTRAGSGVDLEFSFINGVAFRFLFLFFAIVENVPTFRNACLKIFPN